MKVCIIGQGYIGLPTAALFTRNHCEVVGVDVNEGIVNKLNKVSVLNERDLPKGYNLDSSRYILILP